MQGQEKWHFSSCPLSLRNSRSRRSNSYLGATSHLRVSSIRSMSAHCLDGPRSFSEYLKTAVALSHDGHNSRGGRITGFHNAAKVSSILRLKKCIATEAFRQVSKLTEPTKITSNTGAALQACSFTSAVDQKMRGALEKKTLV